MKSSSRKMTVVEYSKQGGARWNFTVRHFWMYFFPFETTFWSPETCCKSKMLIVQSIPLSRPVFLLSNVVAKGHTNSETLVVISARREDRLCHHSQDNV